MKKFLTCLTLIIAGILLPVAPAFADDANTQQDDISCVSTSIIQNADGKFCDDNGGSGVWTILNIVLTILTFGVGIAATAGLVICGIKYATSGTNEAQATNARRRIFEIVIGLIAYAVLYVALNWLIPGFSTTDADITISNVPRKTVNPSAPNNSSTSSTKNSTNKTSKNTAKAAEAREVAKFQKVIQKYTWPNFNTKKADRWKNGNSDKPVSTGRNRSSPYGVYLGFSYSQGEKDCGAYVAAMLKSSGLAKGLNTKKTDLFTEYFKKSSQWEEIPESAIKKNIAKGGNGNSLLKPGDVVIFRNGKATWHAKSGSMRNHQHAIIYIGKIPGYTYKFAEASWGSFTGTSARSFHSSMKRIYADYYSSSNMKNNPTVHVYRRKV